MNDLAARLAAVRPHARQVSWQEKEFIAFFHFGMNTFTGREWGTGRDDVSVFAPDRVDTDQWCRAIKAAGMRGCILTAKHHDGFCLWDTKTTDYSVMRSPFGRDIVRMLADSCAKYGLALGLYLSPWDRHEPTYGQGDRYNDFFCRQLTELVTGYGALFELWFDGACGEGPSGKTQSYDWARIYAIIREHQPGAAIAVCGPDVRWCGNEAGQWRESEWSVVPASLRDCEKVQADSQTEDSEGFRERGIRSCDMDLGSRDVMARADEWVWYPAETNTSIRPGWFYHAAEDDRVKGLDELTALYEHTVGGNSVLLLNIPPTTGGVIHARDEARLGELGARIAARYGRDLAEEVTVSRDGRQVHLRMGARRTISRVVIEEDIALGQRVERFCVSAVLDGEEVQLMQGTTIGYRKICAFRPVVTDHVTLTITECRAQPMLRRIALYHGED